MNQSFLNRLRAFRSRVLKSKGIPNDSGSALVELAVILSFLGIPLLIGTAQMAILVQDSIEVESAAHAGVLYGMRSSTFADNTSGITTAAQTEATDFGTNLSVTPSIFYACSLAEGGTQYSTSTAATSACTGGTNHALEFVQVQTSVSVTPLIHWSKLASAFTLRGSSVMEVEL